jgi:AAA15 family ATPase/GTPase
MLLEFSLKNYFSFKEGAKISFRVNENCPDEFKSSHGTVHLMGIKGANGSGKTNILRAIRFVGIFCSKSFLAEPEGKIGVKQFFGSKKPSEFSVEFLSEKVQYQYDLKVDNDRVYYESLHRKLKRKTKLFERINDEIVYTTEEYSPLKSIKLRSNASIISTAHNHKLELMDDLYYYFACWNGNVTYKGLSEIGPNIYKIAEDLNEHPEDLDFIKNFIVECDGGVSDIVIRKVEREDGESVYVPVFIHESSGRPNKVSHVTESSGTKSLFKYLLHYRHALGCGGVLILDEFDINLHPHILPKLLGLFSNPETNPYNAQMVFSTHNGEVLDALGRYRCYLVNKEDNESYAYRLDEIPGETLRNDRSITHAYNRGDIGGVPRI